MKQAIFLLASLAFARATPTTTDEHSLRGGGVASRRSLQDMSLVGLRPGESNCYLHPDNDGTVECTVRSQYSAYDTNYGYNPTTSLGCVTDSVKGYQFCANIGLNLQADPYGSLPAPPGIAGPAADVPSTGANTGGVWTGSDSASGKCPRYQPTPGSHCAGWIPAGATESSCQFGVVQCNCAGQNGDADKIGWICRDLTPGGSGTDIATPITTTPGASFPVTVPAPTPAPAPVPMIPVTVVVGNVDAEISDLQLPEPTPAPVPVVVPSRTEQVGITISNNPICPVTQPSGPDCSWKEFTFQCAYEDSVSATGWVTCGCTKDDEESPGWKCRDYRFNGFSF